MTRRAMLKALLAAPLAAVGARRAARFDYEQYAPPPFFIVPDLEQIDPPPGGMVWLSNPHSPTWVEARFLRPIPTPTD